VPSNELGNEAASTPVDTSIPIDEPSVEEVYAAIKRMRNGRAPGADGIPPELLKCALHPVAHASHSICTVWFHIVDTVSPLLPDEDVVKLTLVSAGTDIGPQFAFPLLEDGVHYDEAFLSG